MKPIQHALELLGGVRSAGTGWTATCPAHDDKNTSLSIAVGDGERVLLRCHAGCAVEAICSAVGLTMRNLFPGSERATGPHQEGFASVSDLGESLGLAEPAVPRSAANAQDVPLARVKRALVRSVLARVLPARRSVRLARIAVVILGDASCPMTLRELRRALGELAEEGEIVLADTPQGTFIRRVKQGQVRP